MEVKKEQNVHLNIKLECAGSVTYKWIQYIYVIKGDPKHCVFAYYHISLCDFSMPVDLEYFQFILSESEI